MTARPVVLPTRLGVVAAWPNRVVLVLPLDSETTPAGVQARCLVAIQVPVVLGCHPHRAAAQATYEFICDLSSEAACELLWPGGGQPQAARP